MIDKNKFLAALFTVFLITIGITCNIQAAQAKDVRIIVLSLNGDSSGDFSYLTDSIRTMLSTRLAVKEGIEVVDKVLTADEIILLNKDDMEDGEYLQVLHNLNTDYLVSGALYSLQTGLKIQINVAGKDIAASGGGTFTSLAVSEDHILESVEHLVEDIAVRALGVSDRSPVVAANVSSGSTGIEAFSTEHPEKVFKKGVYGGSITAEDGIAVRSLGVRKSSDLPSMLVSMASADLNGDGNLEVVAASRTAVEIFRFDDTRFVKLGEYAFPKNYKIHAVNVADLDGNGNVEIYVSGNKGKSVASAIFSWDAATGLNPLLTDIDWYIRPMVQPGVGAILAGQRGNSDPRRGYVGEKIVSLELNEGLTAVEERGDLALPRNIRLFDFIWADLDGNGSSEIVAIDSREKLLVYDSSNSLMYVSERNYGGSRNFFGPAQSATTSMRDMAGKEDSAKAERQMHYIPTRLLTADLNGDGKQEIIVANNERTTPMAMVNFREYDGGKVVGLSWNETEMVEVWQTNKIEGYIADYNFLDSVHSSSRSLSGDSVSALYISQIPDKHLLGLSMRSKSKLLRYVLDLVEQE
ncbi:FG-GAP repeat domain-containing protein [Desulfosediminicola sp.]|uniref:FG-GAP repeat domain-containing protein n=1 Tax=Desulfosediminicola sp. TaxID=2886825 RepID=UPI003AF2D6FA